VVIISSGFFISDGLFFLVLLKHLSFNFSTGFLHNAFRFILDLACNIKIFVMVM